MFRNIFNVGWMKKIIASVLSDYLKYILKFVYTILHECFKVKKFAKILEISDFAEGIPANFWKNIGSGIFENSKFILLREAVFCAWIPRVDFIP